MGYRSGKLAGKIIFLLNSVLVASAALLVCSCSGAPAGDEVNLAFAEAGTINTQEEQTGFACDDGMVLRCASVVETDQGLLIKTSKARNMKATSLIFVKSAGLDQGSSIIIAVTRVLGKEYEYDISQASYYLVDSELVKNAIKSYGIVFADWQEGAVNDSEKFPCCE